MSIIEFLFGHPTKVREIGIFAFLWDFGVVGKADMTIVIKLLGEMTSVW